MDFIFKRSLSGPLLTCHTPCVVWFPLALLSKSPHSLILLDTPLMSERYPSLLSVCPMQSRIVSPKRVSAALECGSPQTVQEAGVWGQREGLGYRSSYFLSHSLCRTGIGALCVGMGVMQMCGHRCDARPASAPLSTGGYVKYDCFCTGDA